MVEQLSLDGYIPRRDAVVILDKAAFTVEEVKAKEEETKHELAAFVDVLANSVGPEGRWLHFGLTSSDILDTSLSIQMLETLDIIYRDLKRFYRTLSDVEVDKYSVMAGRTHGMHAEITTFDHKVLVWLARINRDLIRCKRYCELEDGEPMGMGRVGKLSGTVGNYSTINPSIAEDLLNGELYLGTPPSSQIIERDIHAEFVWILASIATTLDSIATDLRILAMSEIGEVAEGFAEGQKGSSAMPHKKNPVRLERITGLARLARSYVSTALENSVLWNERDMSHSSVERIMLPDLSSTVHFMIREMIDIISHLQINEKKMRENLLTTFGVVESHKIMLALIDQGFSRQDAYRKIQELSFKSFNERKSFFEVCKEAEVLQEDALISIFNMVFLPKERGEI